MQALALVIVETTKKKVKHEMMQGLAILYADGMSNVNDKLEKCQIEDEHSKYEVEGIKLEASAHKKETRTMQAKMNEKFAASERRTNSVSRRVGGLEKMVDPKRISKHENKTDQLQKTLDSLQEQNEAKQQVIDQPPETLDTLQKESETKKQVIEQQQQVIDQQRLELNQLKAERKKDQEKIAAWLSALFINTDPIDDIRAYITRMEGTGGSLFRDGLKIPETGEEVYYGTDDDDILKIIT